VLFGYPVVKTLALGVMLASQLVLVLTVVAALMNGGWVVVVVDRFNEGLAELVTLATLTPISAYVAVKEVVSEARKVGKPRWWRTLRRKLGTALAYALSPLILIILIIINTLMWAEQRRHGYIDYEL